MPEPQIVFEGSKIRLERHQISDRDGRLRPRELVVHPGAAVVVPVLPDGRIVMIRNWRFAVSKELLELPAGTLDAGEPPEQCARRELEEETGYRAGRLQPLVTFYTSPGFCDELMHVFLADGLETGTMQLEPGEQIRVETMPREQALAEVAAGRVQDGKSLAALLYYDRFAGKPAGGV